MPDAITAIDTIVESVARSRSRYQRCRTSQIRSQDDKLFIRSLSGSWFDTHRIPVQAILSQQHIEPVDSHFIALRGLADRFTSRQRYIDTLGNLKQSLVVLREECMKSSATQTGHIAPPQFSTLVQDPIMLGILNRRWNETQFCMRATAHLSATVMMGGLLEALILARINSLRATKGGLRPVFTAKTAPKDRNSKPLPLTEWTLQHYIDIAHELGWISKSAKDVSIVLRDYRNFIHPQKELTYKININERETSILWPVFVSLARQLTS